MILDFWNASSFIILNNEKTLRVFFVLFKEGRSYFEWINAEDLLKLSSQMEESPPKIYFFLMLCKFLPHKESFSWKVPSKISYTFDLRQKKSLVCTELQTYI